MLAPLSTNQSDTNSATLGTPDAVLRCGGGSVNLMPPTGRVSAMGASAYEKQVFKVQLAALSG